MSARRILRFVFKKTCLLIVFLTSLSVLGESDFVVQEGHKQLVEVLSRVSVDEHVFHGKSQPALHNKTGDL